MDMTHYPKSLTKVSFLARENVSPTKEVFISKHFKLDFPAEVTNVNMMIYEPRWNVLDFWWIEILSRFQCYNIK